MGRPRKKKAEKAVQVEIPAITEVPEPQAPVEDTVKEEIPSDTEIKESLAVLPELPEVKIENPIIETEEIKAPPAEAVVQAEEVKEIVCPMAAEIVEDIAPSTDIPKICEEAKEVFIEGVEEVADVGSETFNNVSRNISNSIKIIKNNNECIGSNKAGKSRIISAKLRSHRAGTVIKSSRRGGVNARFKLS